jgi:hypothetical protein
VTPETGSTTSAGKAIHAFATASRFYRIRFPTLLFISSQSILRLRPSPSLTQSLTHSLPQSLTGFASIRPRPYPHRHSPTHTHAHAWLVGWLVCIITTIGTSLLGGGVGVRVHVLLREARHLAITHVLTEVLAQEAGKAPGELGGGGWRMTRVRKLALQCYAA